MFLSLPAQDAGDPSRRTAVPCRTVEESAEVDDLVATALAAGGRE